MRSLTNVTRPAQNEFPSVLHRLCLARQGSPFGFPSARNGLTHGGASPSITPRSHPFVTNRMRARLSIPFLGFYPCFRPFAAGQRRPKAGAKQVAKLIRQPAGIQIVSKGVYPEKVGTPAIVGKGGSARNFRSRRFQNWNSLCLRFSNRDPPRVSKIFRGDVFENLGKSVCYPPKNPNSSIREPAKHQTPQMAQNSADRPVSHCHASKFHNNRGAAILVTCSPQVSSAARIAIRSLSLMYVPVAPPAT